MKKRPSYLKKIIASMFPLLAVLLAITLITDTYDSISAGVFSPIGYQRVLFAGLFSVGFIIQFLSLTILNKAFEHKKFKSALFSSVLITLLTLVMRGRNEHQYDFYFHILAALIIGGFTFSSLVKESFAPRINEQTLLIWSLFFPYLLCLKGVPFIWLLIFSTILLLPILNIYTDWDRYKVIRVILYIIFLLITILTYLLHFHFSDIRFFFDNSSLTGLAKLNIFIAGTLIAYIIPYCTYLLYLVPIRTKNETKKEFRQRLRDTVNDFSRYFDHTKNHPWRNTILGLSILLFLSLNFFFRFMPQIYVLTVVLILVRIVDFVANKKSSSALLQ